MRRKITASTAAANAIAFGTLLLKAKIGELLPREKGGRGKVVTQGYDFSRKALAAYRRIADHREVLDAKFPARVGACTRKNEKTLSPEIVTPQALLKMLLRNGSEAVCTNSTRAENIENIGCHG